MTTTSYAARRSHRLAALAAVGALAATAIAVPAASAGAAPAKAKAKARPLALPSDAQIQAAIDQVDTRAKDIMSLSHMPGMAVAVVWKGHVVFAQGYGVRKLGSPAKVDLNTVFQLASVSKSVGSTVIAREVTKGTIDWTTKVKPAYPGLVLADPYVTANVTVADMYSHRSGLRAHAGDLLEELGYTQGQIASKLRYEKLTPFRTVYAYTNYGMAIAAQSVANRLKLPWWQVAKRDIYTPLGMTRTSSRYIDYVKSPDRAWTHRLVNGKFVVGPVRDADGQAAAGSVSSSISDMAKWLIMVLGDGDVNGKQFISQEALKPALLPQEIAHAADTPGGRTGFYGYGFNVDTTPAIGTRLSHSGAFSAGALDLGIITLSNAYPQGWPEILNAEFGDLVQNGAITQDWRALYGNAFAALAGPHGRLVGKKRPAKPVAARSLSAYLGSYRNS